MSERHFLFKVLAALFLVQYIIYLMILMGCIFGPFFAGTQGRDPALVCPNFSRNLQGVFELAIQTVLALLAGKSLT